MRQERIFFAVLFTIITILAMIIMQPFLTYIILAGILTYTLFPVYRFINGRLHRPELSSALCILVALTLMVLPAFFLVTELVQQVSGAYTNFQAGETIQRLSDYLSGLTGNSRNFDQMVQGALNQVRQTIVGLAPDILGSIGSLVLGLFIMFFVMFYGFREGESFIRRIKSLVPLDPNLKEALFFELRTVTQAVLYGQVMTAVIQGTLGGLALLIFGVPNALFWGAIMIITAFLPVLGTPMIWVPAAVGLMLNGDMTRGIGLMIVGATIVMNIDNFIRPRLVSGRTSIHPVLILIGVLGGLQLFGFIGMLIGPLVLAMLVAFVKFYEQSYLVNRVPRSAD
jgi:predicted PurR-regulated permease PerM